MKPTQGRRTWVKLYAEDWLDGTTRYQMSGNQRAFWIDLLAMAGRGRVGGIVCAGKDGDKLIGYPIEKFQALSPEPLDVLRTFELFQRTEKIRVESEKNDYGLNLYVIHILNWTKYQSEYERVKPYRQNALEKVQPKSHPKSQSKSQPKSQKSHKTEVEVEVDSDSEPEPEKRDDDDDDARHQKRAASSRSPKELPLDPTFKAWAESRILRTAKEIGENVKSPRAYVRKSLPSFLSDTTGEIVAFLCEQAEQYFNQRIADNKNGIVPFNDIVDVLRDQIRLHHLPAGTSAIDAGIRRATEKNKWMPRTPPDPIPQVDR